MRKKRANFEWCMVGEKSNPCKKEEYGNGGNFL